MRFLFVTIALATVACVQQEAQSTPDENAGAQSTANASIERYVQWSKECDEGHAPSCGLKGDYLTRARETLGHGRGDEQGARDAYEKGCRLGDAHSCDASGGARVTSTNVGPADDSGLASLDPTIPETCQKFARKACHAQSAACRAIVKNVNEAGHKPDAKTRCAAAWDKEMRRVP
jgi:hypothetical protein